MTILMYSFFFFFFFFFFFNFLLLLTEGIIIGLLISNLNHLSNIFVMIFSVPYGLSIILIMYI